MNKNTKIYSQFHTNTKKQSRIITQNNFTYRIILNVLVKYLKPNQSVLDIGCGPGTIALWLADKVKRVDAIDISKQAISVAKESAALLDIKNVHFMQIEFPKDAPSGKYNLIILMEVLEHLTNDRKSLEAVYRLLDKDGLLILSTPSINAPMHKLGLAKDFDKKVGHLRRYSEKDLISICESIGFKVLEIKKTEGLLRNFLFINPLAGNTVRFIKLFLSDIVTILDNLTLKLFGESQIFVVAQK